LQISQAADSAVAGSLFAAGITTLDIGGATDSKAMVSADQADALIAAGLVFAADDDITLEAESATIGTHLSGNKAVAGLGLGVDAIAVTPSFFNNLGSVQTISDIFGDTFAPESIAMDATDADGTTLLDTLHKIPADFGIGALHISSEHIPLVASMASAVSTAGFSMIDIGGVAIASANIGMADAAMLINSGLSFAAADTVALDSGDGEGTELLTTPSLDDLAQLGIDSIAQDGIAQTWTIDSGYEAATAPDANAAAGVVPDDFADTINKILETFAANQGQESLADFSLFEEADDVTIDIGHYDPNTIDDATLTKIALIGVDSVMGSEDKLDITGKQV
jgi:hypothetical protein